MASMAYGEPRLTNDIDIVADIDLDQVQSFPVQQDEKTEDI